MKIIIISLIIFVFLLIPMKIASYGFLPRDDALRHSAKVISGKGWGEILVLRDDIRMDSHPGWHAILSAVHNMTDCDGDSLVVFSVVFLFILFCLVPIAILDYPEAWPITLLVILTANPSVIMRLFLGRPYIFTMSVVLTLCFLWPNIRDKKNHYFISIALTLLIAISTYIHGGWYLFALPLVSFFLAREWRAGLRVGICTIIGTMIGASLTGHPFIFLKESLFHMFYAFGNHQLQRMLVGEFQPFSGDVTMVIATLGMLTWRRLRGSWDSKLIDEPVFILASMGWVLGFVSQRFWLDWGFPALAVWMTQEFRTVIACKIAIFSRRRILLTAAVLSVFYVAVANDVNGRWTSNLTTEYLSNQDPKQAPWLPSPGGIVYSDDMTIFYQTFFKNPHAPWRYILGFEPAMMPKEDLAIFRRIQWNFCAYESFEPWVRKMRPEDRLILRRPPDAPPKIPGLDWYYAATGIWIGRPHRQN